MPCPGCLEGTCPVAVVPELHAHLDADTQDDLAALIEEAVRRGVKAAFKEMAGERDKS